MNHSHSPPPSSAPEPRIATGFDFEPLPTGDVLIDFYGDDGVVFNSQIITRECLTRIPVVAHALFLAIEEGKETALAYLNKMSVLDHKNININEGALKAGGFSADEIGSIRQHVASADSIDNTATLILSDGGYRWVCKTVALAIQAIRPEAYLGTASEIGMPQEVIHETQEAIDKIWEEKESKPEGGRR